MGVSLSRRAALQAGAVLLARPFIRQAHAAESIAFSTWSAAVDQVKAYLAGFEKQSGITVAYTNSPYAQYRETMDFVAWTAGAAAGVG